MTEAIAAVRPQVCDLVGTWRPCLERGRAVRVLLGPSGSGTCSALAATAVARTVLDQRMTPGNRAGMAGLPGAAAPTAATAAAAATAAPSAAASSTAVASAAVAAARG